MNYSKILLIVQNTTFINNINVKRQLTLLSRISSPFKSSIIPCFTSLILCIISLDSVGRAAVASIRCIRGQSQAREIAMTAFRRSSVQGSMIKTSLKEMRFKRVDIYLLYTKMVNYNIYFLLIHIFHSIYTLQNYKILATVLQLVK